jgi:hypothetical protein
VRRSLLAALCLLVATSAWGQSSVTYERHRQGDDRRSDNVDCTTAGTDLVIAAHTTYDQLSICFWASPSSSVNVFVCPGSATCTTGTGAEFSPGMGLCLDWSNQDGGISCVTASGTGNVSFVEERG